MAQWVNARGFCAGVRVKGSWYHSKLQDEPPKLQLASLRTDVIDRSPAELYVPWVRDYIAVVELHLDDPSRTNSTSNQ